MMFNYVNIIKNISEKLYNNNVIKTRLLYNKFLSDKYNCNIYLK